jgi:hypothetical protein
VVADCVAVLPLGSVSVKATLAPEAGVPPLVTEALMEAVPGREKVVAFNDTFTASEGAAITVAFAVPVALEFALAAFRFTS